MHDMFMWYSKPLDIFEIIYFRYGSALIMFENKTI